MACDALDEFVALCDECSWAEQEDNKPATSVIPIAMRAMERMGEVYLARLFTNSRDDNHPITTD